MSDIIGGENHFPLGFGSTDRTFDLDFSAGDSAFGLDFGSAIIGGRLLPDGGEAGDVLTLAPVLHGDPKPAWLSPQYPAFFNFRLDSNYNVVQGPTWAEVLAVPPEIVVIAIVSTPNGAEKRELRCIRRQDVNYYHPVTIQFSAAIGDATYDIVNGETNDSWFFEEESIEGVIDYNIIAFSDAVIGDLADLDTSDQSNLVAAINEVAGRYEKPSTGIPKTDLASDVQTSLGKADTALQQHQSLAAYRTAADQDTIDAAQDTAIAGKLPATGNAYRAASIPMGQLDSTSTATDMTATVPGITELRDGVCMWLKNGVISSASGVTLDINGLGAKPLYSSLAAASRSTTIFSSAYTLLFIYNSTRVDGGCWDVVYGIDTNTNTIGYQLRTNSATMPMASVVYRYRLLFTSADGTHLVPANNSSSTNATSSRTVCQTPIDPFGTIYYYGATASVAANASPAAASLWTRYVITLGYSFNRTGAALVLTPNVPVYIKCAPQTNGSAIIDADNPYVQTLPTTEDGKIYILLGIAAAATTVEIQENHPVYCYRKGAVRKWTGLEAELDALLPASGVSF